MLHIITHPLIGNYGGALQAYALQQTVKELGYSVNVCEEIPSFARSEYYSPGKRLKWKQLKERVKLILGRISYVPVFLKRKIAKNFKNRFMIMGDRGDIKTGDAFIVGSDQVWRLQYTRTYSGVEYFFLDFATQEQREQSITYAASFGTDEWEGTHDETVMCRELIRNFKAVSIRELSGVALCQTIFGIHAVQMPDPTLLLKAEVYRDVIKQAHTWKPAKKYMATYVLDSTEVTQQLIQETAQILGVYLQPMLPDARAMKIRDRFPMSVPQWLRCIQDCECMVTDSFHGCVFGIIFNKPFVCLGNAARGSSRFDTLLETFGLHERLLTNATPQAIEQLMDRPIDWTVVNSKIAEERKRGLQFLQQNLPKK